jgi:hypothetical protein
MVNFVAVAILVFSLPALATPIVTRDVVGIEVSIKGVSEKLESLTFLWFE